MTIQEFVDHLKSQDFFLIVEKDKLVLRANREKVAADKIQAMKENKPVIDFIRDNKEGLIRYVNDHAQKKQSDNISSIYKLSALQEGMLFHGLYNDDAGAYIEQFVVCLSNVDILFFKRSWDHVIRKHSVLRSGFYYDAFKIPVQCVYKEVALPVEGIDYRNLPLADQDRALKELEERDRKRGFDFKAAPLMRITLIQLDETQYRMLFTWHHILFDGWSAPIIFEEFLDNYKLLLTGKKLAVVEEDRFEDYIRYIARQNKESEESHWRGYLNVVEEPTFLPFIKASERTKKISHHKKEIAEFSSGVLADVEAYTKRHHITVNTVMQGVWAYLLYRYADSRNVIFGTTVSGRPEDLTDVERRVGMYINTLPVSVFVDPDQDVVSYLRDIQQGQVQSKKYQYTSLKDIQNWSAVQGDLFDSILTFQNYPLSDVVASLAGTLKPKVISTHEHSLNYPLAVRISVDQRIQVEFLYKHEILDERYVKLISGHFEHVLLQIISDQKACLRDVELLTPIERKQILKDFNNTQADFPERETIVSLFRRQAEKTPEQIAVVSGNKQITYAGLHVRSNQLAHYLKQKGVSGELAIPLTAHRSVEMIIGILGILKAGAAYVPIDPEYPAERMEFILDDVKATTVMLSVPGTPVPAKLDVIDLVSHWDAIQRCSQADVDLVIDPGQLAYVIYTSGSTGKPKGVMIEHAGLANVCLDHIREFSMNEEDRYLQFMSTSFDGSILDIFSTLLSGATLLLPEKDTLNDRETFLRFVRDQRASIFTVTPSYLSVLDKAPLPGIRTIISAGEAARVEDALYYSKDKNFYNGYGPSEVTVNATLFKVNALSQLKTIPIGKPRSNKRLYILSKNGFGLAPVGVPGEICIGGVGLARGYLNHPELTAARFLPDPFAPVPLAKFYRTGDLGCWLPDGNVEYIGRIDDQVKIRGYRIELGEIESVLQQSGLVKEAVVIARQDGSGDKRLVGYVVTADDFTREKIQSFMEANLPPYMIPAVLVELENLPATTTGKIDKKALPDPEAHGASADQFAEPTTGTERTIAGIWSEVLGIDRIGIFDRFFELGGDSIKVISVVSRLQKAFGKEIRLQDVYEASDLKHLATVIDGLGQEKQELNRELEDIRNYLALLKENALSSLGSAEAERIEDVYPMSDIQNGMVYASLIHPELGIYHDQAIYPPVEKLDLRAFEKALSMLVKRHSILRTAFNLDVHHEGLQLVYKDVPVNIRYIDVPHHRDGDVKAFIEEYFREERKTPFDVTKAPLWRFTVLNINDGHIFLFQCHHAILDGWSVATMNTELNNLYLMLLTQQQALLKPLACSYKDFIIESLAEKRNNNQHRLFWKEEMNQFKRLDIFSSEYSYDRRVHNYGSGYLSLLAQRTKEDGLSLKALFLGAYAYVLRMLTYEDDLTLGMVTNTRPMIEDGDKVLGCFLNSIPFRSKVDDNDTWKMYFARIEAKIQSLKKYERTTLFEIRKAADESPSEENPFFDTLFNFVDFHIYRNLQTGLVNTLYGASDEMDHEDYVGYDSTNTFLDCTTSVTGGHLSVSFTLRRKLRSDKTLDTLHHYFKAVLDCYLNRYTDRIQSDAVLPKEELDLVRGSTGMAAVAYPYQKTITSLFDEQVARTPDHCAVSFENERITYRELNERANQLANYLRSKGLTNECLVPICVDRSIEMIVGILGILKAGGAYVPVDPAYPAEHIGFIVNDCDARIIICDGKSKPALSFYRDGLLIDISDDWNTIKEESREAPSVTVVPSNLAYVIYTSGSTGKPKGVMIEHKNVVRLFETDTPLFDFHDRDVWPLFHSFCFDFSVWEMYGALFYGGRLVIVPRHVTRDALAFSDLLVREGVTILNQTPSAFYVLQENVIENAIASLPLRYVIFGGEALNPSRLKRWKEIYTNCRLINMYGITETTVHVTYQELSPAQLNGSGSIIGKPIPTLSAFILDRNGRLSPIGVVGELYIGGLGLAREYLNRPDLTREKFITDPLSGGQNDRLYRTADLGRWLPDGSIEYLGRIDDQVKIRGFRIELGAIEEVLLQSESVDQAVVLAPVDHTGNRRLVAYVVPRGFFAKDAIYAHLKSKLPEHMVPGILVELTALPLTRNGKLDKRALPDPAFTRKPEGSYMEPQTETERKLAGIYKELLGAEQVGVYDNFFELGGHSLLATRAISLLKKEFSLSLPIRVLFQYNDISSLAKFIELELLENKTRHKKPGEFQIVDI